MDKFDDFVITARGCGFRLDITHRPDDTFNPWAYVLYDTFKPTSKEPISFIGGGHGRLSTITQNIPGMLRRYDPDWERRWLMRKDEFDALETE